MTTDNKQFALTDAQNAIIASHFPTDPTNACRAHAAVMEILSKLRGAGEPSDEQTHQLAFDAGAVFCGNDKGEAECWQFETFALREFARALLARYALTSGHSTQSPDTSSGHSEPVAEVQLHPHDASKAIVVALVDFEVVDVGMQLYDAPQASAEVRNAALEEAAATADKAYFHHAAKAIRALKSAPAAEDSSKGAGDVDQREAWEKVLLFATQIRRKLDSAEVSQSSVSGIGHDACERAIWIQDIARAAVRAVRQQRGGDAEGLLDRLAEAIESGDYGSQIKYLSDIRIALAATNGKSNG